MSKKALDEAFVKALAATGKPKGTFRFSAHIEDLYKRHKKTPMQNVIMRQLGDSGDYTRTFRKFAKWNVPVSVLKGPDVVRRYRSELSENWPTTKEEHLPRVEFWKGTADRLSAEHQKVLKYGTQKYGGSLATHGDGLSGGHYEHWPADLKERSRFAVQGAQDADDAYRLHRKLAGKRS